MNEEVLAVQMKSINRLRSAVATLPGLCEGSLVCMTTPWDINSAIKYYLMVKHNYTHSGDDSGRWFEYKRGMIKGFEM